MATNSSCRAAVRKYLSCGGGYRKIETHAIRSFIEKSGRLARTMQFGSIPKLVALNRQSCFAEHHADDAPVRCVARNRYRSAATKQVKYQCQRVVQRGVDEKAIVILDATG